MTGLAGFTLKTFCHEFTRIDTKEERHGPQAHHTVLTDARSFYCHFNRSCPYRHDELNDVMPVKTGIHEQADRTGLSEQWTPASAGVTKEVPVPPENKQHIHASVGMAPKPDVSSGGWLSELG